LNVLGIQDFDFSQILIKFAQILFKLRPSLINFAKEKKLLGKNAVASPTPTALVLFIDPLMLLISTTQHYD